MENNRRRYERFPFYESVSYQKRDLPLDGSLAEDISRMGLKLNVNEFIPVNSILDLQFQLPGQAQIIFVPAKVVWVRQSPKSEDSWQIGVELVENRAPLSNIEYSLKFQKFKSS